MEIHHPILSPIPALEFNSASTGRADFTVVAQRFGANTDIPSDDFLSPIDCWHPNEYAQSQLATWLWKSYFSLDRSSFQQRPSKEVYCPTPEDKFYTDP